MLAARLDRDVRQVHDDVQLLSEYRIVHFTEEGGAKNRPSPMRQCRLRSKSPPRQKRGQNRLPRCENDRLTAERSLGYGQQLADAQRAAESPDESGQTEGPDDEQSAEDSDALSEEVPPNASVVTKNDQWLRLELAQPIRTSRASSN